MNMKYWSDRKIIVIIIIGIIGKEGLQGSKLCK